MDGYRNFWTQNGATPLLMAAKGADAEMMRLLAAHGADPTLTNRMGTTPLMAAAGVEMFNPNEDSGTVEEAFEAVKVALELGADVNQANKAGDTPLHGAAWRAANDIVQLLVDRGARLDSQEQERLDASPDRQRRGRGAGGEHQHSPLGRRTAGETDEGARSTDRDEERRGAVRVREAEAGRRAQGPVAGRSPGSSVARSTAGAAPGSAAPALKVRVALDKPSARISGPSSR